MQLQQFRDLHQVHLGLLKSSLQLINTITDVNILEEIFTESIETLQKAPIISHQQLLEIIRNKSLSNCIVTHLRFILSAYLQQNREEYETFVPQMDIVRFCKNCVEPCDQEAEDVCISALAAFFSMKIEVVCLDNGPGADNDYKNPNVVTFGSGEFGIVLLYRPGHYDILFKSVK